MNVEWKQVGSAAGIVVALGLAGCAATEPAAPTVAREFSDAEIAEAVFADIDQETDPCDDFYRYACGSWLDRTPLPADQPIWGRTFSVVRDKNLEVLKGILEESRREPGESGDRARVGNFYGACMDTEAIEAAAASPLDPWLAQIDAIDDRVSFLETVGRMQRFGAAALFEVTVFPDFKDPSRYLLFYSQGGLGLPNRDFYFREDERSVGLRAAYQSQVAKMLGYVGTDPEAAAEAARGILEFETALASNSRAPAQMRDLEALYNKIDLVGLKEKAPSLSWEAFQEGTGFPGVEEINIAVPEYFEALDGLVSKADLALLKDYLRWNLISATAPWLADEIAEAKFDFYGRKLSGQQEQEPRWKRCATATDNAVGEALGRLYVEKKFAGNSKELALSMIHELEDAFEANLPSLEWMDDTTRQRASEKKAAIRNKIGYPDSWRDYSALELSADHHFGNSVKAAEFEFDRVFRRAGQTVDRGEWGMTPPTVNAYYNPTQNEIVFPAGILQPPVFHRDFPAAMNFGGMGSVVGHELTHGFDDSGRKFDGTGQLREWWAPEVSERFEERAACIEEQYNGYEVADGLNVNGKLTLGENIADLGGVKAAFSAYRQSAGEEARQASIVEGLTHEQLYFVAFAQVWCATASPEFESLQVRSNTHSLPRFRVNGPLSNLPAFAEVFGCAAGTPMVRDNACEVW